MGLDWNPGNKPKPGHEDEFDDLFKLLTSGEEEQFLVDRFHKITISAYETLEAPQVGIHPEATEWARRQYVEQAPDMSEEAWLLELDEFYVLDLVPPCDGLPKYTNGPAGYVENFSFRAQFLKECVEIVGTVLLEKAHETRNAAETVEFGRFLIEKAENHAKHRSVDISTLHDCQAGSMEEKLDIVLSAGRWCLFWGQRGHPMEAYF